MTSRVSLYFNIYLILVYLPGVNRVTHIIKNASIFYLWYLEIKSTVNPYTTNILIDTYENDKINYILSIGKIIDAHADEIKWI